MQASQIGSQFSLGSTKVIDPEHVQGAALEREVSALKPSVIYLEMGNTYALRHHLRVSGADELVRRAVEGGAVLVGSSAGSICIGRTVQMAFWKNWDDKTASGTISVDWTDPKNAAGLNLGMCSRKTLTTCCTPSQDHLLVRLPCE